MSILFIILGFLLLVLGGEFLVRSSVGLSFKLNLSKLVIGMTVVSFATSAPELLVSLQAALSGSEDLALGNVIGSNIANIALVLGITAIISPLVVGTDFYKMNWPAMMIFSIVLYFFLKNDLVLSRFEGIILFVSLIGFIILMIMKAKIDKTIKVEEVDETLMETSYAKIFIWLVIGAVALYFGSDFLVDGSKEIALNLGVSERVIGLSVVAVGTSVPELAASIIAAKRGEKAISLGNLIGSNIFNIGSVLGLTAMIKPIQVIDKGIITKDIFWMIAIAAILIPLVLLPKKYKISRLKGILLLSVYIIFLYIEFST
ncbi:MAG: calcium/sodium antiporter [Aureibaculum sp.]|nr:calcium/sodium antiporter [Aureibaculum sp.]